VVHPNPIYKRNYVRHSEQCATKPHLTRVKYCENVSISNGRLYAMSQSQPLFSLNSVKYYPTDFDNFGKNIRHPTKFPTKPSMILPINLIPYVGILPRKTRDYSVKFL